MDTQPKRRWYRPTPGWLVFGSLATTGLLFLSERWRWFWFNEHKGWTVLLAVAAVGVAFLLLLLWLLVALLFRLRFQFSLRSLAVLVVAVALPFSWLAVEMKGAREQAEAVAEIKRLGGYPVYDLDLDKDGYALPRPNDMPEPAWLRTWLGDDFFIEVVTANMDYRPITDSDVAQLVGLKGLKHLTAISLSGSTQVTDTGLAQIARLTDLRVLWLYHTGITDVGLAHIAGLTRLEALGVEHTQVTDAGLSRLVGLHQLHTLLLMHTRVTEAGLADVAKLPKLRSLGICGIRLTKAGLAHLTELPHLDRLYIDSEDHPTISDEELRRALPQCEIRPY